MRYFQIMKYMYEEENGDNLKYVLEYAKCNNSTQADKIKRDTSN